MLAQLGRCAHNGTMRTIPLGFRLRIARWDVGLTQAQLATALGISRRTIQNYERGNSTPSTLVLQAWATECCVPLWWLTNGELSDGQ